MVENLSLIAYESIKKQLLTGTLDEAGALNVSNIARELGISRTPVKEAMIRLASEDLVVNVPNKGFVIQHMTTKKATDLLSFFMAFELFAIDQIRLLDLQVDIAALEQFMKLEEKYIEQKDYYELFRNNYHFHINIIDTLDNHELTTIYSAYADKTIRMGFASRQNKENLNMMHQEHLYILNDLKNKDYENATKHVRLHTEKAKTRLIII